MTQLFKLHTQEEHTSALAAFLPNGEMFDAKNVPDSIYRMFLRGLAVLSVNFESKIFEVAQELYIPNTIGLLEEWERTVGIPDDCFSNLAPIRQRQAQVMVKLAGLGVVTVQDFINLARFFGYNVTIGTGTSAFAHFTYTFDFQLSAGGSDDWFTMYVFYGTDAANVFPYKFPFTFGDPAISQLECIFRKLVPACVNVVFVPSDPVPDNPIFFGAFSTGFSNGFSITV